MRNVRTVALVVLVSLLGTASIPAGTFFVAPDGADNNPGTFERPFATLQHAQAAARKLAGRESVTVFLKGGTWYLSEPLVFTPVDSGSKEFPVAYQACGGETPILSGGSKLLLKWNLYRDGIMQAKIPPGITFDQLFVNGMRQHLARYPNFDPNVRHFNGYAADALSPQRVARWKDPRGGFIHAMHAAEWGGMHYRITGKGPDGKLLYEGGWQNNRPSGMHPQYRMVENIFEELDAPGEWFLDNKTGTLYYYPPAGLDLSRAIIEVVRLRHLVEFRGTEKSPVRFVHFKGLTFRHAARTFMDNREPLVRSDWTTYRGGASSTTAPRTAPLRTASSTRSGAMRSSSTITTAALPSVAVILLEPAAMVWPS